MTRHALTLVAGADGFPVDPMDGVRRYEEKLAGNVERFLVPRSKVVSLRFGPGAINLYRLEPLPQALASLARPFSLKVCP